MECPDVVGTRGSRKTFTAVPSTDVSDDVAADDPENDDGGIGRRRGAQPSPVDDVKNYIQARYLLHLGSASGGVSSGEAMGAPPHDDNSHPIRPPVYVRMCVCSVR